MPTYTSPEYQALKNAIARCHRKSNKQYKTYGSRGIRVCLGWRKPGGFDDFLNHVGLRPSKLHSLDRIDNDRGYEPGNVRWATRSVQSRNSRHAVMVEANGERLCLVDWAEKLGVKVNALIKRKLRGWSDEDTINVPVDRIRNVMRFWHGGEQ